MPTPRRAAGRHRRHARTLGAVTAIQELLHPDGNALSDQTLSGSAPGVLITEADLQDCHFEAVNLEGATLKSSALEDCDFHECNLANAQLVGTVFTRCRFVDCKLVGADWSRAGLSLLPPVTITFERCILDYASLSRVNFSRARFIDCSMRDTDFTDANLSKATLGNCELTGARFHGRTCARPTSVARADTSSIPATTRPAA